jgi:hypothetical protein
LIETSSADTGFIGDQQLRRQRERPRDAQPLPLAAGEFMRKAARHVGREADPPEKFANPVVRIRMTEKTMHDHRFGDCAANGLARIETRERILEDHLHTTGGLSAVPARSSARTSSPSNSTVPEQGSTRRRIERPVVDLPQPLSPTSASVSPACSENEISSTA